MDTSNYPVDSRFSWLVALLGCFVLSMSMGLIRCIGIILIEVKTVYTISYTEGMWMLGLCLAFVFAAGPMCGYLIITINHRNVMLVGMLNVTVSLLVMAFASDYRLLFLAFSLLGLGVCFTFMPCLVASSYYFYKRRASAVGITACGTGVGTFYLPPLVRYLFDSLSYMETLVCVADIYLHVCLAVMFIRPESSWSDNSGKQLLSSGNEKLSHPAENRDDEDPRSISRAEDCDSCDTALEGVNLLKVPAVTEKHRSGSLSNQSLTDVMLASTQSIPALTKRDDSGEDESKPDFFACLKTLFCNKIFLIYMLTSFFLTLGYTGVYTILPLYGEEVNAPKQHISYAVAVSGVGEICGRLSQGFVADRKWVTVILQVAISELVAAGGVFCLICSYEIPYFYVANAFLGLLISSVPPLVPIFLLERFSSHTASVGVGFIYGGQGLAVFVAYAATSYIWNYTSSWLYCIWFMISLLIAGVINLVTGILSPAPNQKHCNCLLLQSQTP